MAKEIKNHDFEGSCLINDDFARQLFDTKSYYTPERIQRLKDRIREIGPVVTEFSGEYIKSKS